jgi:hypothetical protein
MLQRHVTKLAALLRLALVPGPRGQRPLARECLRPRRRSSVAVWGATTSGQAPQQAIDNART